MSNNKGLFAPPTKEELQKFKPSADANVQEPGQISSENIDDTKVDEFLKPIQQIESSGGKNLNHPVLEYGMHKGTSAIGRYALMPLTVDEIVKRSGDKSLSNLMTMSPDEKKNYIENNPEVENKLARTLAKHVLKRARGDFDMAAYAWNQGHNLTPDQIKKRDYLTSDYVQKFKKAYQPIRQLAEVKPSSVKKNKDLFAPPSKSELERFKKPTIGINPEVAQTYQEPDSSIGTLEAAGLGAVQGATMGYADEAEAGLRALYRAIQEDANIPEAYEQERGIVRERYKEAERAQPGAYLAGNIGGGVATAFVPGLNIAKGASIGRAALQGAGLGAAAGLGASEADLLQGDVSGAAIDTAIGAGIGGVTGAAAQYIGKALTPEATKARATARATKALGKKPLPENLPAGEAVLEEGVLPVFGGSPKTLEKITGKIGEIEEGIIQPTLKEVSENTGLPAVLEQQVPINELVGELSNQYKFTTPDNPLRTSINRSIDREASFWGTKLKRAAGNPAKLNALRKEIDEYAKALKPTVFNKDRLDLPPKYNFLMDLRNEVNNYLRGISSEVSEGAGETLTAGMQRQSKLLKAKEAAESLVEKDLGSEPGSIMDMIKNPVTNPRTLGVGAAKITHSPVIAATVGGTVLAEKATSQPIGRLGNIISARAQQAIATSTAGKAALKVGETTARAMSGAARGVQTSMQNLYTAPPEQLQIVSNTLMENEQTKTLGDALKKAVEAGDQQAKDKVIFSLMQRPDTREIINQMYEEYMLNDVLDRDFTTMGMEDEG